MWAVKELFANDYPASISRVAHLICKRTTCSPSISHFINQFMPGRRLLVKINKLKLWFSFYVILYKSRSRIDVLDLLSILYIELSCVHLNRVCMYNRMNISYLKTCNWWSIFWDWIHHNPQTYRHRIGTVDVLFPLHIAHVLTVSISRILRGWICAEWVLRAAFDSECAHRIVLLCARRVRLFACATLYNYLLVFVHVFEAHNDLAQAASIHEHKQTICAAGLGGMSA
jgi:hypothetical protein